MTRRKVSFLQGTVPAPYKLPAEDHRLNHAGLWVPSSAAGAGLRVLSGIVAGPGNPGQVSVVAGGVNVNPFQAVIQGSLNGSQGVYEAVSDAVEFRAVTAASAAEFRRGYVIARVYDQLNAGTGAVKDDWDVEVVYGPNAATAGAATLPPLPANSLILREFAVSNTGVITLVASSAPPWQVARGGVQPVAAADVVAPAFDGQVRNHPTEGLQRGMGGVWQRIGRATAPQVAPWLTATRASVNNYNLASIAVPAQPGPYVLVARVTGAFTVPSGAAGNLRLFVSTSVDFLGSSDLTPSKQVVEVSKYLPVASGASVTVTANLEVLTGSITHYGDPRHSVLEVFAIPMVG